jgi:predicted Rossmann fold flavoprotein
MIKSVAIIGGGAAGIFCAINLARMAPDLEVIVLEKSNQLLGKVKISGGGRCNVTHACFEPKELVKFYPRGGREMLGPFHYFQPGDVFEWFEIRGIPLKTEDDNRVFPITNDSQTIIDCFMREADRYGVRIKLNSGIQKLEKVDQGWQIQLGDDQNMIADAIVYTTGSSLQSWKILEQLGHQIIAPVPSLFTFNVRDERIQDLMGISATHCSVRIEGTKFIAEGPVLITHWGLSGPGILKLSAWAARELHTNKYDFIVRVNWDTRYAADSFMEMLKEIRLEHSKALVRTFSPARIPNRLWIGLLQLQGGLADQKWGDVSNKQLEQIADAVQRCYFKVQGKSTFKDEFVTAGGLDLKEVDFKSMESKLHPNLFFAGEVLNIDAVTGGFNFQAAWTTSMLAARNISEKKESSI